MSTVLFPLAILLLSGLSTPTLSVGTLNTSCIQIERLGFIMLKGMQLISICYVEKSALVKKKQICIFSSSSES